MRLWTLLLLAALAFTLPAQAGDLAASNLLVPVAGRTAGSFGSQWATDLVVTNTRPAPVPLILTWYGQDGARAFTILNLAGYGTHVLEDVLPRTFEVESGLGMIRVSSAVPDARFTARAYIYNRGLAGGEYGQGVPAMPVDALTAEHVLSGITAAGRRTNIGVANPWTVPASIILTLYDRDGQSLGQLFKIVPPLGVLQINDAFAAFGVAPAADASVHVFSQVSVYAYASVVRNDTGDPVFVTGTGIDTGRVPDLTPRCAEPAAVNVARPGQQPADGWIVLMAPGTSVAYLHGLAGQHGYTMTSILEALPAFTAELTPQQITGLRCEANVLMIEQNVVVPLP